MTNVRTYDYLIMLPTFEERFEYLKLSSIVGIETFGFDRYINQFFYKSNLWIKTRDKVIIRDGGCDLGIQDRPIFGRIYIHHIQPITKEDILNNSPLLFDMNNLICVSKNTHDALHYSDKNILILDPIVRTKNDTCPWKGRVDV